MVRNLLYKGDSLFPEYDEKEEVEKVIHKKKKKEKDDFFYMKILESIPVSGYYQMPTLKPYLGEIPTRLVPFNIAYAEKDYDCTVHFLLQTNIFCVYFRIPKNIFLF